MYPKTTIIKYAINFCICIYVYIYMYKVYIYIYYYFLKCIKREKDTNPKRIKIGRTCLRVVVRERLKRR